MSYDFNGRPDSNSSSLTPSGCDAASEDRRRPSAHDERRSVPAPPSPEVAAARSLNAIANLTSAIGNEQTAIYSAAMIADPSSLSGGALDALQMELMQQLSAARTAKLLACGIFCPVPRTAGPSS